MNASEIRMFICLGAFEYEFITFESLRGRPVYIIRPHGAENSTGHDTHQVSSC